VNALATFQSTLGYEFRNPDLLRLALTHPSLAQEAGGPLQHNQRLEFLGDAALQLVLTRHLYERFPEFGEGQLTKARARLVNRRFLAEQARKIRLGASLLISRGEEAQGGRDRPSALADAFEALLGAVFLDGGLESASQLILRLFGEEIAALAERPEVENPKGDLQEILQAESAESPQYTLQGAHGPDHNRVFECAVSHRGVILGRGRGHSKKEAESRAALAALEYLRALSSAALPPDSPRPTSA
jgi:ribonuclease-3